ncbi:lipoyl(octanoyl) transferase LipB [Achromobacter denitrificans]|uniref:Octanoyltransferase n=1 Tax=Achromobacter denitrificans TaxID=32002 RepID=A0ABZ3G2G7_ACHDE|nr:lipoyl(octanoyl) transferase LipB [Achromobacter denitrificans]MPT39749.1 lipoyl(octanoyl) transferase LipB [Achromobacter sp.]MDF3861250.1 lipoyl(octanoyl) transferase LipB [Achromobacter denitrificans]OLU07192.1 octanoyltransferase [Achromobacter denitrificans]QKH43998.1 lipoyl(octanoyl) transferase LipB [Achromobacter denitrificans]QKH48861.1 lipoyl(octanoyl) transferase LipB [Achromobacter denitrificans]
MIKWLARPADYLSVWQDMQAYTNLRGADTPDEIWLCEHAPVYTLGQAGLPQHILNPGDIPIVRCDRGGQVTYHGPGQVMAYALFDLRRADMYVKEYVTLLEGAVIDTLAQLGVQHACRKPGAPGVYVPDPQGGDLAKIAALGIKIRNGRAYHGVSLNVSMDLAPFLGINPCGYQGLRTVDMASCGARREPTEAGDALGRNLQLAWARARNKT